MKDIDVLILCGGKGERLSPVIKDRPKVMAEILGRPFLDILIEYVLSFGLKRFILCLGYHGEYIQNYYQKRENTFDLVFSREDRALGTGGAVKNAQDFIKSDPFIVMNGDSFCRLSLEKFYDFHITKNSDLSMVVAGKEDSKDFGSLTINSDARITAFQEKIENENNFVNGGIYILNKKLLVLIPQGAPISLEYDFFPKLINKGIYGFVTNEPLIDIGTPQRYEQAKAFFAR